MHQLPHIVVGRGVSSDCQQLFEVRRRAIIELTSPALSDAEARAWAEARTPSSLQSLVAASTVLVADVGHTIAGWTGIQENKLTALYVHPSFSRRGVGSSLLSAAEMVVRQEGYRAFVLEASKNAEPFYARRGFTVTGPTLANGAIPMQKELPTIDGW